MSICRIVERKEGKTFVWEAKQGQYGDGRTIASVRWDRPNGMNAHQANQERSYQIKRLVSQASSQGYTVLPHQQSPAK